MYDASTMSLSDSCGILLGKIDEKTQVPNSNVALRTKRQERADFTRVEEQVVLWIRNSSITSSCKLDDPSTGGSSCSLEDLSSSSYGCYTIAEVSEINPAHQEVGHISDSLITCTNKTRIQKGRSMQVESAHHKKHVRFAFYEKGGVVSQTMTFKKISKRCHSKVWWSDKELDSFRMSCLQIVCDFQHNDSYLWALNVLYPTGSSHKTKSALKKNSHRRQTSKNGLEQQDDHQIGYSKEEIGRARQVVVESSEARGLEIHISPLSNRIIELHTRSVLKEKTIPRTWSELRRKSEAISKLSAIFASTMAELDIQETNIVQ